MAWSVRWRVLLGAQPLAIARLSERERKDYVSFFILLGRYFCAVWS